MKKDNNLNKFAGIFLMLSLAIVQAQGQQINPVLKDLIQKALQKNHELKITDYKITKTEINRQKVYKTFLPALTLNAGYTRLNDDIILDPKLQLLLKGSERLLIKEQLGLPFNSQLPPTIPTSEIKPIQDKNILKSSADLQWVIFTGLEAHYGIKATQHKEKALRYAREITTKQSIKEVMQTYDRLALVIASEKVLNSIEKQLDLKEKQVQSAVKNGLSIKIDLQKIAFARQKLQIKRTETQNQKALLWEKLHQLTGASYTFIENIKPDLKPLMLEKSQLQQLQKPVEIKSLEEIVQAKNSLQKMTYAKYLPKIAIKGHYEFLDDDLSMLDPKWYVGIGLKWQIFDGLKAIDQARKLKYDKQIYREKIQQTQELLNLAVKNARLNYHTAEKQIALNNKAVQLAKDTYRLVEKQYANGLVDITELLKALTEWQKAGFKLQEAYYHQRQAALDLLTRIDRLQDIIQ